jgi:hypothetical protein
MNLTPLASSILLGLALVLSGCGQSETKTEINANSASHTPTDPVGTWTSGDKDSVFSRLTVLSSGTFRFETVDFTGDVKDGYSGRWQMKGKSIQFEWGGGGADSGSCSGRRTGERTLVFGSTTFRK